MHSLDFLEQYGFFPFRRAHGSMTKPHLSLRFREAEFHIDSSRGKKGYNIITHAHSDHYGKGNVRNRNAIASHETARILEELTGRKFAGSTFSIGDKLEIGGIEISTHETHHMYGSAAFLFKSESRILVTGDVKDYSSLPKCDVLICEATYGSPADIFKEEIHRVVEEACGSYYGVYPVGKAQRIGKLLNDNGIDFSAEERIAGLCRLFGIEVADEGEVHLTTTRKIYEYSGKKYILTAQRFYRLPRIVVSDHLDYRGLINMVEHCKPEAVIFYHGRPTTRLLEDVRGMGVEVATLNDLERLSP